MVHFNTRLVIFLPFAQFVLLFTYRNVRDIMQTLWKPDPGELGKG